MGIISDRDYEALLGIVAAASQGSPDEPMPAAALEAIRALFPAADSVAYFEGLPRVHARRWVRVAGEPVTWTAADSQLLDQLRTQDPLWPTRRTLGRAWRRTDLMSYAAYRRTELYQRLGRSYGIEYSIDFWTRSPMGVVRGLSVDGSDRDFSERDRQVLDVLGRHLGPVLARWDPRPTRDHGLTEREAEVLAWAARGRTNQQIAHVMSISAGTVRKHLENAFLRLGVHTRAAAVARLSDAGVFETRLAPGLRER